MSQAYLRALLVYCITYSFGKGQNFGTREKVIKCWNSVLNFIGKAQEAVTISDTLSRTNCGYFAVKLCPLCKDFCSTIVLMGIYLSLPRNI